MKSWNELKQQGSAHYKTGDVEPIDLYRSGHMFQDFALASIMKYAFRSREEEQLDRATFLKNMDKIIHYASLLKAENVAENTANVAENTAVNVRTLDGGE